MVKNRHIINEFVGAAEYFAYEGLLAGFQNLMTLDEVYEYLDGFLFNNETTKECQNCFLNGFLLGREIKNAR
jgi:hypothetical protein